MKKTILLFGLLITALIFLFQLSHYRIEVGNYTSEIVIAITSVVFFMAGVYFTRNKKDKSTLAATISNEVPITDSPTRENAEPNYKRIKELGISSRELEVLNELAKGKTNKEIGETLFISESTIKTHVSNLYSKLNVSNRAQAIIRSKELEILPK